MVRCLPSYKAVCVYNHHVMFLVSVRSCDITQGYSRPPPTTTVMLAVMTFDHIKVQ